MWDAKAGKLLPPSGGATGNKVGGSGYDKSLFFRVDDRFRMANIRFFFLRWQGFYPNFFTVNSLFFDGVALGEG